MSKVTILIALTIVAGVLSVDSSPEGKISLNLRRTLQENGFADIVVSFSSTRPVLNNLKFRQFASRADKLSSIAKNLQTHARYSQKSVLQFLSVENGKRSIKFQSYWINNKIFIKNADRALIDSLVQFSEVLEIRQEIKGDKIEPFHPIPSIREKKSIEWGLEKINVKKAWDKGINGSSVVVGILDSGVMYTHESLRDSYVGKYGWFAPIYRTEMPEDNGGHGTHVMGTIVGQGGIGVAPGARWMACQNIPGGEGEDIACGQYMLCPHLPDGSNPDCSKAPHLVSNSWGYIQPGDTFMDEVLAAWEAADIVPIFGAGNEGPSCRSLRSPGDSKIPSVITVGSTDTSDKVSGFSSNGPSYHGQIKPNIAAPGSDIRSAGISHDSSYTIMSGTSMAAPHVAGVVALIRSAHPNDSIQDISQRIYKNAADTIANNGRNCGDVPESTYPNNHVGHGLLSATAAL